MKVIIKDEDELVAITKELLHCMVNLRHWTKLWERDHGSATKASKKFWEGRADELLEKLEMRKTNQASNVKIEIKNDQ
jgi:hypothetical protein